MLLLVALLLQDPDAIVTEARSAVAAFERSRRSNLPWTTAEQGRRCEEHIGRYCYWYDAGEPPPPAEGAVIATARLSLLVTLGAAALRAPDEAWLLGQRVRYLLEAGRGGEAQALSGRCAATREWCAALLGLAFHESGDILAADSAFTRALRLAPAEARCAWLDISLLLRGGATKAWRRLSCQAQAEESERWLELGRPLLAREGNSVRTEFLSRQVRVRLAAGTATPFGVRFDEDQRETVLRYGWPIGWSQVRRGGAWQEASIRSHDPSPAWGFLPTDVAEPEWQIGADRPRARFHPPGVTAIFEIEDVQMARMPRDEGTLLVAAWQLLPASPLNVAGVTGVLAGKAPDRKPAVAGQILEGRGGVATALAMGELESGGLELLTADGSTWARHREVWTAPMPTSGPVLSDLLLFEPTEGASDLLEQVLPRVIRGTSVREGGQVGVYWEWGRLPIGTDSATITLEIGRSQGGAPVLSWSWEAGAPPGREGHGSMALDLTRLGRGEYHLHVVMTMRGVVLRSRRRLQIT